ncbi:helix-turn-helix domain-containing protein [Longitalea luteola]|uniref:helix-turn-helix domain-containing protein n=1 Tax=Longitalea luteola TaxID=2812563 RepID=UPI001A961735|nr:AraC family transcriptional regulator [Longitalea luteola]
MPRQYKKGVLEAVRWVKKNIDNHPNNGTSTAAMARMAGVSRNALQEVFKAKYGTSIGQYKLNLRMKLAAQHLKTGKSIKETAILLQYSSASSFCNAFRSFHEASPTDWLKNQKLTNANKQARN